MGNLEKAGVGVVVALLLIIMVVAFATDPQATEPIEEPKEAAPLAAERETDSEDPGANIGSGARRPVLRDRGGVRAPADVVSQEGDPVRGGQPAGNPADPGVRPVRPLPEEPMPGVQLPDAPAAAPSEWPKQVVVEDNDSLWRLAERAYGRKLADRMVPVVRKFNRLTTDVLHPKQKIQLPAPPTTSKRSDASTVAAAGEKRGERPASPLRVRAASAGLPWEPGPSVYGAASLTSADGWYVVKQNESLSQIAQRQLGSVKFVKDIIKLNGIKNPDRIAVGTRLRMPTRKKSP